ncbi:DNRLRE domain-containing protein [Thermococcus sp. MV11]|uniref:CBM96 family carbohydrate-binding protein n=1 Tax=Thermococcus sp. MV11 TaxID=1638267 RepID=UPI001430DBED|nr:DNRLRE domain-containing protein [Thermococcus sp. MV11]NJE03354.1 DNRLRE domain-containing protein [Thermococcus sp. MV11]
MKRWGLALIALLVLSLVPSVAFHAVSAATTTVQINPTDDAYVKDTAPDSNYGSDSSLYVGTYYRDNANERAYLKFDLSGIPDNAVIVSATLHAYTYWGAYSTPVNISAYAVSDDSWTEDSITWNTKPAAGELLDKDLVPDSNKRTDPVRHWSVWNVTDFVKAEFSGDKVVSFVLVSDVEGIVTESIGYNSKESSYGNYPYLEVVYYVPEGPSYQPIREIRENWETGKQVVTSGIVIGTKYNGFFIQNGTEPNSGIYVYTGSTPSVKVGDVVQVNGTTAVWKGLYEISNPSYKVVGKAELPEPVVLKVGEINDSYQSMLVRLEWIRVTRVDGKLITIADDTGSLVLYDYYGVMDVTTGKILKYLDGIGYKYNVMEVYPLDYELYIPSIGISEVGRPEYAIKGVPMRFKVTVINNGEVADNVTVVLYANGVKVGNVTQEIAVNGSAIYELSYVPTELGALSIDIQVITTDWGLIDERIYDYKVVPNPNVIAYGLTPYYERLYSKEMETLTPLYENLTWTVNELQSCGVDLGDFAPRVQWIEESMVEIQRQYQLYDTLKGLLIKQNPYRNAYYYPVMVHIRKAAMLGRDVTEEINDVLPVLQAALAQVQPMCHPPAPANETEANPGNETVPGNETGTTPETNVTPTTNITLKVTKVLIDASHGQYYVKEAGVSYLVDKIQSELGWEVEINQLPLTYDLLRQYDVVIITDPKDDFTPAEIESLKKYVENGGGLFIAGEWYKYLNADNLNAIVGDYGITFNADELMDDDKNSGRPYYPFVGIYNKDHPVMKFVPDDWTMYYNGDTLTISGNAVWLIKGYDTSYSVDADGNVVRIKGTNPIIAAAVDLGTGRIVAYGSSKALSDSYYQKYIKSNWPFIKGALLWLAHQE